MFGGETFIVRIAEDALAPRGHGRGVGTWRESGSAGALTGAEPLPAVAMRA